MIEQQTYTLPELREWLKEGGYIKRLAWEGHDMLWDCVWYIDRDGMLMAYYLNDVRSEYVGARAKDIFADDWVKVEDKK